MDDETENLRRKVADLQKRLSADEIVARSELAVNNLVSWLTQANSNVAVLGVYRPHEPNRFGEADPSAVLSAPILLETHFAFPRVTDRFHRRMEFAVPMHSSDWVLGVYGILEPNLNLPEVDPQEFDAIIVPGVVFGLAGERIGRGAGFYDRFLARAPGAIRIGFGFDFQLLPGEIPQESWDARMDVVVTDQRVVNTGARPSL